MQAPGRLQHEGLREQVACVARRGIGMTLAAVAYWLALAMVSAWAGLAPGPLGVFFLVASALIYPLGYGLNRAFGGDLLARGHPLAGFIRVMLATQLLMFPLMLVVFLQARPLLALVLAALLGGHFLPYAWLYRSRTYFVLGSGTVLLAGALHLLWPAHANVAIPLAMAVCYAVAVVVVMRVNQTRCDA